MSLGLSRTSEHQRQLELKVKWIFDPSQPVHYLTSADWKCQITLYDKSVEFDPERSLEVNFFDPKDQMPDAECGDVVVVLSAKVCCPQTIECQGLSMSQGTKSTRETIVAHESNHERLHLLSEQDSAEECGHCRGPGGTVQEANQTLDRGPSSIRLVTLSQHRQGKAANTSRVSSDQSEFSQRQRQIQTPSRRPGRRFL